MKKKKNYSTARKVREKKNKAQQGKCARKKLGHSRVSEKQDNNTSDAHKKKLGHSS